VTTISRKAVAVVDDDPGMRRALKNLLSSFEYAVYVFDSAEAFLRAAATSRADCLVIDVQLPDISGIELVRELSEAGFTFPVIFMTAVDDDVIRRQAVRLGCVAYLHKPFASDLLIEAIVKATGQSSRP
jgi:FixJ family two-component response regulator